MQFLGRAKVLGSKTAKPLKARDNNLGWKLGQGGKPSAARVTATKPTPSPIEHPIERRLQDLPAVCFRSDVARTTEGIIRYPAHQEHLLERIRIGGGDLHGRPFTDVEINLASILDLYIDIMGTGQRVTVGRNCTGAWILHLWGKCEVIIDDDCTSNHTDCFVNPGGELWVGRDCMMANCYIHVGDNHAIFDLESMELLNYKDTRHVVIGEHVWMAARASVLSDSIIGPGSVVGSNAVVKGNFPAKSLIAGHPAAVRRSNISWTRSYFGSGREQVAERLKQY